jgi:hypothetical protein
MSNGFWEIAWRVAPAGFLPDVTSTRSFSHQTWIRGSAKSPLLRSKAGVRGYREVSAYSTVEPEFAWEDD